ncbi:bifunctional 4-hydroxy-2-oxoglutarate aldolase/2-dehydro-3-deoxy-phosphogluconate aldolase [Sphaerochaeta globosa]|uniref:2-dehydro-3-deoxyphosphogluconate aldolase/4-hydroxy-2-oxoglutarate aldolase n=1 Tax=Sphaerochaeta globosa (strain ATCC BAA-1886 / DSM 22777 / Buddy) TaxID=158189 RepID=F0RZJ0_SPHGB|nr:bifunctional 4-hydroxy-2-oxoglutarate aldolase/2-dehydro-3-deoxy-phosphogluconate aldolase [Sphaerochaeta globosa]ADY13542.1 2-dehydro-3-deoxyphosphogluconate aldolase/4-hydroxy-2-oxoglutarate aldolase [Sphaerochaeta globosa str. Buddy]
MTHIQTVLQTIGTSKVISIIRGIEYEAAANVIAALKKGGVSCLEVTMNTNQSLAIIEKARLDESLLVGAGTVLDVNMARECIRAGAQFVLSPLLDIKVIEYCLSHDVLPVPGVFTPTELYSAHRCGAPLLKIFPAGGVGPQYIKDLLGPFNGMKLLPVGGVSVENTAAFMKAGSFAVGVGSYLANPELSKQKAWETITQRAKLFIEQANQR